MRTRSEERQQQKPLAFFIDQKPVGIDVAFPFPEPVPGERMVVVSLRQRRIGPKQFDGLKQSLNILALLQHELDIFLELRGALDMIS